MSNDWKTAQRVGYTVQQGIANRCSRTINRMLRNLAIIERDCQRRIMDERAGEYEYLYNGFRWSERFHTGLRVTPSQTLPHGFEAMLLQSEAA